MPAKVRPPCEEMNRLPRFLLVAGGTVAVILGIVGVFVPLLPTTPFLLLAVFLYARSSTGLHNRLLENRWIGGYLRRYCEQRCMTRRHKVFALAFLWGALGFSAWLVVGPLWARLLLGVVAVGVTTHLLLIPSEKEARVDRSPRTMSDSRRDAGDRG